MADTNTTERPVVVQTEKSSGAGAIAAVIVTLLLVVFGWWAINNYNADGDVVPDEIGVTITDDTDQ